MPTQLTVPGVIAKWILAPVILAGVGYYLVGPRIGKSSVAVQEKPVAIPSAPPTADLPPSASPDDSVAPPKKPKRHHHRAARHGKAPDSVSATSDNFPQAPSDDQGETGSESSIAN